MCAPLGSVFSFHLDFEIIGVNQAKLSFSNIYRNVKVDYSSSDFILKGDSDPFIRA